MSGKETGGSRSRGRWKRHFLPCDGQFCTLEKACFLHIFWQEKQGGTTMSPREAIRILMLSPIYFRLRPAQRWQLVREYCRQFSLGRNER